MKITREHENSDIFVITIEDGSISELSELSEWIINLYSIDVLDCNIIFNFTIEKNNSLCLNEYWNCDNEFYIGENNSFACTFEPGREFKISTSNSRLVIKSTGKI